MIRSALAALLLAPLALGAAPVPADRVCASCVKAHVERLAAPDLHGRRCGSVDEARAADYLEGELKATGVAGAWAEGGYRQPVPLETPRFAAPPTLALAGGPTWTQGEGMLVLRDPRSVSGALARPADPASAAPGSLQGAVVFVDQVRPEARTLAALARAGAAAVLTPAPDTLIEQWTQVAQAQPELRPDAAATARPPAPTRVMLKPEAAAALRAAPEGAPVRLTADRAPPAMSQAVNLTGVLHGSAPDADAHAILLSAHYDHLGERGGKLYPGANDDASGTAAVLEFARMLAHGPKPKRTVYFALFPCEEAGLLGSEWFGHHPVTPIANLAVNLEFEMIGFPDPKRPDKLMMTGYERSDLGDALVAHGAKIGPDLYPEGHFFQRSDNYQLARAGVVAHTFSGWPTPPTYHQPSDDPAHVDFAFMADTIQSLAEPVRWLADGGFTPSWRPGGKP